MSSKNRSKTKDSRKNKSSIWKSKSVSRDSVQRSYGNKSAWRSTVFRNSI
jgi:hypothetical protein